MVGIENVNIWTGLDIASRDDRWTFLLEHHVLDAFGVLPQRDLLDVEDDIGHILANARDGGKLVQHAVDMN